MDEIVSEIINIKKELETIKQKSQSPRNGELVISVNKSFNELKARVDQLSEDIEYVNDNSHYIIKKEVKRQLKKYIEILIKTIILEYEYKKEMSPSNEINDLIDKFSKEFSFDD